MEASDIDLTAPTFDDHPKFWRSPEDLADAFVLAWSLESVERTKIDPWDPYNANVNQALPARFRFDTLGLLIKQWPGDTRVSATHRGRLTCLALVWRLFEQLNKEWCLQSGDFIRYSGALEQATRASYEPGGVFSGLNGNIARCLLADRIQRASSGSVELTQAETWFVTGHEDLLVKGQVANVPFMVGGNYVPVPLTWDELVLSAWTTARVLVQRNSAEYYIAKHTDRTPMLLGVLDDGAEKIAAYQRDAPWQVRGKVWAMTFTSWPE